MRRQSIPSTKLRTAIGKLACHQFKRVPHRHFLPRNLTTPTFSPREWLRLLKNWPKSYVLKRVTSPVTTFFVWGLVLASANALLRILPAPVAPWLSPIVRGTDPRKGLATALSLIGGTISLLLVFRTNTAYSRFWGEQPKHMFEVRTKMPTKMPFI